MMKSKAAGIVKNSKPNKKLPLPKRSFAIPPHFLAQLEEFCNGGYIIILGDEFGEAQVHSHFDNSIAAIGLTKFGKDYLNNVGKILSNEVDEQTDLTSA